MLSKLPVLCRAGFVLFLMIFISGLSAGQPEEVFIGIDLGTTYSSVALIKNGHLKVCTDTNGERQMPSVVGWDEDNQIMLVGSQAWREAQIDPDNALYGFKQLMGLTTQDKKNLDDIISSYVLKERTHINAQGYPRISGKHLWEGVLESYNYSPEELSAWVLRELYQRAKACLDHGQIIGGAVISVPNNYLVVQEQAVLNAARSVPVEGGGGLPVVALIPEPLAVAYAYFHELDQWVQGQKVLIFDFGGGTLDVSIVEIVDSEKKKVEVKGFGGDSKLGGDDFTERLRRSFVNKGEKHCPKWTNADIVYESKVRLQEIRDAKHLLSNNPVASVEFCGNKFEITSKKLDNMFADYYSKKARRVVARALLSAGLNRPDIDIVVLAGGASRMPQVYALLNEMFPGKVQNRVVNPDEAVVMGAALRALQFNKEGYANLAAVCLQDVLRSSLGVSTADNGEIAMNKLLKTGTSIPCSTWKLYTASREGQTKIDFGILEGEEHLARDNTKLGNLIIPVDKKAKVNVTMNMGENNLLSVTAVNTDTKQQSNIEIKADDMPMAMGLLLVDAIEKHLRRQELEQTNARIFLNSRIKFEDYVERALESKDCDTECQDYLGNKLSVAEYESSKVFYSRAYLEVNTYLSEQFPDVHQYVNHDLPKVDKEDLMPVVRLGEQPTEKEEL